MTSFDQTSTIGFIGAGAVGGSLGVCLSRAGYRVVAVASRTFASAQQFAGRIDGCQAYRTAQAVTDAARLVVISTADDAIRSVADSMTWRPGQMVVHCSGATSLDVFQHPVRQGAVAGAIHPLQAFSSVGTRRGQHSGNHVRHRGRSGGADGLGGHGASHRRQAGVPERRGQRRSIT